MCVDITEYEINLDKILGLNESQRKYIDKLITSALTINTDMSNMSYQILAFNTLINNEYLIDKTYKRDDKISKVLS